MSGHCIIGDCLDVLPTLVADSLDACVTDPPYGIGFMGKEWDTFKPGIVKEARLLVKSEPIVSDNPNLNGRRRSPAVSVSQIEYDRGLEGQRGFQSWTERWAREVMRVLKPGAHLLICGAPRSYHRMVSGIEDAGFEIRDCIMWVFSQGFPKSHNLHGEWEGWGTAFKPAWEPILVARKPLEGTVAQNVAKWGCGALNIDASRIESNGRPARKVAPMREDVNYAGNSLAGRLDGSLQSSKAVGETDLGRWPANLIHDGSEEVLECFPEAPGQLADAKTSGDRKFGNVYSPMRYGEPSANADNEGGIGFKMKPGARRLDSGSAARFFYCAKTSRQDRNEGCESIGKKPLNWSSGTKSPGTFQSDGTDRSSQNNHPTVKPTALMRYLVRLVTPPPGGTVLDPFAGSGSTGKACALDGFGFVGIEREQEYAVIADARIALAERQRLDETAQQGMVFA